MPDLLVTGAHGQLGCAVLEKATARGLAAVGHDLDTLDITDAAAVTAALERIRPRALVNCAAWTAVDDCEGDPGLALEVNGTAVGHLAAACAAVGATLVQVSTDYVFSGASARPYREDDPVGPTSAYGRSKLEGERLAQRAPEHLVVRTAWLFGRGGRSFVTAIRGQVEAGSSSLRVVADQRGCPTYCDDLAEAILGLLERRARGTVHAVNSGATTWHAFALEIVRQLGAAVEVRPALTADVPRPAPRPANSVLDTSRLAALLGGPLPTWQDALRRYLAAS